MEKHHDVRNQFNAVADQYDEQRRKLIPCFDDFYQTAAAVAEADSGTPRILDLGAGTGLLSSMLLRKYPQAKLTLIDISERMLEIAKLRLQAYENVEYVTGDYTNFTAHGQFDIIVSALSIHHLGDEDKMKLYRNAYLNLKPNGVFVNADQVLGGTPFLDSLYKNDWKRKVEASGLSREDIDAAYERTKLDRMAPLDAQIGWLRESGFAEADCIYKYFNFVVMYGRTNI